MRTLPSLVYHRIYIAHIITFCFTAPCIISHINIQILFDSYSTHTKQKAVAIKYIVCKAMWAQEYVLYYVSIYSFTHIIIADPVSNFVGNSLWSPVVGSLHACLTHEDSCSCCDFVIGGRQYIVAVVVVWGCYVLVEITWTPWADSVY